MNTEDKKRLFRRARFTIRELELILQGLSDRKAFHFRQGNQDVLAEYEMIAQKIKQKIERETNESAN